MIFFIFASSLIITLESKTLFKNKLKTALKNKSKIKQFDSYPFLPSQQFYKYGPYGMYSDLSQPLRMQDGYLVPDDEAHLPKEYVYMRDRLLYERSNKISAKPVEIGDGDGNFIKVY